MTQLTIVANIHANPDQIDLVRLELEKLVPITRAEEGCIQYDLHRDNDDPAHFVFYENWESRELWQTHMNAPHVADYMQATDGAVAEFTLSEMTNISLPPQRPGESTMKAVALTHYLPVENPNAFLDVDLPKPAATGRDILVAVKAVSINPVDTKVRAPKDTVEESPRVLGWDASGVVESVGPEVTLFKPGDEVYYAGDITRSGSNAEFQLVDERIVGFKPKSLGFAEAAALPLTTITAYEAFFDRLGIDRDGADKGQSVLIIGAGGGVGSIAIQLAKAAGLVIIATASRPETESWVKALGADHVVNHRKPMVEQVRALGFQLADHIAIFNDMRHWDTAVELIRPQGGIVTIADTDLPMPMEGMKMKAASLHWEFMFARAMHQTPDMIEQHKLLTYVANEIDAGRIRTTLDKVLSPINAENIRVAHALIETGTAKGKVVVESF